VADTTATPLSLASLKSRKVYPFWCQLTQVVLEKGSKTGVFNHNLVSFIEWHNFATLESEDHQYQSTTM